MYTCLSASVNDETTSSLASIKLGLNIVELAKSRWASERSTVVKSSAANTSRPNTITHTG